mmetsp:Transcript_15163/g.45485  ORF Transcript_15163/g.45485 Transcript_15163/m.45485 type:complete len:276 (+) Transcript_15163:261-1088(+)
MAASTQQPPTTSPILAWSRLLACASTVGATTPKPRTMTQRQRTTMARASTISGAAWTQLLHRSLQVTLTSPAHGRHRPQSCPQLAHRHLHRLRRHQCRRRRRRRHVRRDTWLPSCAWRLPDGRVRVQPQGGRQPRWPHGSLRPADDAAQRPAQLHPLRARRHPRRARAAHAAVRHDQRALAAAPLRRARQRRPRQRARRCWPGRLPRRGGRRRLRRARRRRAAVQCDRAVDARVPARRTVRLAAALRGPHQVRQGARPGLHRRVQRVAQVAFHQG